ncbi:MAG: EthD domain-containing protein [Gammaproteobacteria bacterium]
MIKSVVVFRRQPGMSVEDFAHYWEHRHGPIVAHLPGLRRYVQSQTLASAYARLTPACDGVAELWFDDTQALRALAGTPEYAAVLADEANFIDPASRIEILTEDIVIKDGPRPPQGVKSIELVKKRPDLTPEAFHRHWEIVHGPLGASIPQVLRYVQSHTRLGAYRDGRQPPLDGLALTWFVDTQAMRASATTPQYATTRADEHNFVTEPLDFVIAREREIALPGR